MRYPASCDVARDGVVPSTAYTPPRRRSSANRRRHSSCVFVVLSVGSASVGAVSQGETLAAMNASTASVGDSSRSIVGVGIGVGE